MTKDNSKQDDVSRRKLRQGLLHEFDHQNQELDIDELRELPDEERDSALKVILEVVKQQSSQIIFAFYYYA